MATTVAAMKGKLGSTEYFVLAMKAKLLAEKGIIPSEMEDWPNMSLEEREQRALNLTRVKNQIAPYLMRDKDRFFGAIILAGKNLKPEDFEPLGKIATEGLPRLYQTQTDLMGFLTLQDGVVLIPLDGQHRLKALQLAIEGRDKDGKKIGGHLPPNLSLANEDITVMLIPYDAKKARKIFTKVNRYAKPTTTGQNLVMDDDDIIAILSRMVADDINIIGGRLVKYTSNTLNDKEGNYFTTLATIAECNVAIWDANFPGKLNRTEPLEDRNTRTLFEEKVRDTWGFLVENIDLFADALVDKEPSGDNKRTEIRENFLLGKPVPQVCLVKAFVRLTSGKMTARQAAAKLNAVAWNKNAKLWDRVLMSGGKILHKNKGLATDLLCYMAGEPLDKAREKKLLDAYRIAHGDAKKQLPDRLK